MLHCNTSVLLFYECCIQKRSTYSNSKMGTLKKFYISKLTMKNRNYVNDANLVSLLITLNLFQTFFRLEQIACSMPIWRVWAHKTSETHSFFRRIQFFLHGCFFSFFGLQEWYQVTQCVSINCLYQIRGNCGHGHI